MEIGKSIYNILSNDSDVSSLVGTRIYPNRIAIDQMMPSIVYQVVTTSPSNTKNGVSNLDVISIQIYAFGNRYEQANELSLKIRNAMDYDFTDQNVGGNNIQHISFQAKTDEYDESFGDNGIHYCVLDFDIRQKI